MRPLEQFETFHINGAVVFFDFYGEYIKLTEQSDTFSLVFPGEKSIYFERDTNGFVNATANYDGKQYPIPSEFNIFNNVVGAYQINPSVFGF